MHMNDGRVVSNFVIQALQNEPITVSNFQVFSIFLGPRVYMLCRYQDFS